MSVGRRTAVVDGLGAVLVVLDVGVTLLATRSGGIATSQVTLLLATAATVVVARLVGLVHRALIPGVVVGVAVGMALTSWPVVGGGPLSGPFGYRNATGAFYVQAAVAALMVILSVRRPPLRLLLVAVAVSFVVVAAADSLAAGMTLAIFPIVLVARRGGRWTRLEVVVAGFLVLLVLVGTVVLGATYKPGSNSPLVRALTDRRLVLWHESLQIIADHPGGVGAGRFRYVAPTAIADRDARWAHNEFLQQGVELGWSGLVLAMLLFLWGFARLLVHPEPDAIVALGAVSLAALGMHASVDYILHFPAVLLATAALVGTAQALPLRGFPIDRDRTRQEDHEDRPRSDRLADTPTTG